MRQPAVPLLPPGSSPAQKAGVGPCDLCVEPHQPHDQNIPKPVTDLGCKTGTFGLHIVSWDLRDDALKVMPCLHDPPSPTCPTRVCTGRSKP